ncbi:hypothetical protein ACK3TF_002717 [Chlorella vulgaris]
MRKSDSALVLAAPPQPKPQPTPQASPPGTVSTTAASTSDHLAVPSAATAHARSHPKLFLHGTLQLADPAAEHAFRAQYARHSVLGEICLTAAQCLYWLASTRSAITAGGWHGAAALKLLACVLPAALHLALQLDPALLHEQHRHVLSALLRCPSESAFVHMAGASATARLGGCLSAAAGYMQPRAHMLLVAAGSLAVPPLLCKLTFEWSWALSTLQLAGWLLGARAFWTLHAAQAAGSGATAAVVPPHHAAFWELTCICVLLTAYGGSLATLYRWEGAARKRFVEERLGQQAAADTHGWQVFVVALAVLLVMLYHLSSGE